MGLVKKIEGYELKKKFNFKHIFIISLFLFILVLFQTVVKSETQNQFNDTSFQKNFTINGIWSNLTYLKLPKYSVVSNSTLNITGIQFGNQTFTTINRINNTILNGNGISMATDSNKMTHIVVCSSTDNKVYYLNGSGNSWSSEIASTTGGSYCAIAVDSNNNPHICFSSTPSFSRLDYANKTNGVWTKKSLATLLGSEPNCAIAVDSNNDIGILDSEESGSDTIYYSFFNKSSNTWSPQEGVISQNGLGQAIIGLAFDTNNDPHISFTNSLSPSLWYGNRIGGNWITQVVDSTNLGGYGSGSSNAIAVDSNNKEHISYGTEVVTKFSVALGYANNTNSGIWSSNPIDTSTTAMSTTSIKTDESNFPIILYKESSPTKTLKYIRYDGSKWNQINITIIGTGYSSLEHKNTISYISFSNSSGIYFSSDGFYPSNVTLDVGNDGIIEFNTSGVFNTKNTTKDFSSAIKSYLASCIADSNGFCNIPINVSGIGGRLSLDSINISYIEIPRINIVTPTNNTNQTSNIININYTVYDTNLQACKYTRNSGITNTSIICGDNITKETWNQGYNNVTLYANDSAGNTNQSSVSFYIDSLAPSLIIDHPSIGEAFDTNVSLPLNYSIFDSGVGVSSCVFNLDNGANSTITNCVNVTFNTSAGSHTLNFFGSDIFNNTIKISSIFVVSLSAPAITLNYPNNNTFFNSNNNVYLNWTASDPNSISSCQIYHDFNGTFSLNKSRTNIISGVQAYETYNVSEGNHIWNIKCNNSLNQPSFSLFNFTFITDITPPSIDSVNISTTAGSTTVYFNLSVSDSNLDTCKFYITNSSNNTEIGNPFSTSNTAIPCSSFNNIFSVLSYDSYYLNIIANDSAGNTQSKSIAFSTTQTQNTVTNGGSSSPSQGIPVIGIKETNTSKIYTDLDREIIYAQINSYCSNKVKGTYQAIADYSSSCQLTISDLMNVQSGLLNYSLNVPVPDLTLFFDSYRKGLLFQGTATQKQINDYNLFTSVLGLTNLLNLIPGSVDKIAIINSNNGSSVSYVISSNKPLKSCEVISDTPDLTCEVTNSTVKVTWNIKNSNFFNVILSGSISVTTDAPTESIEQRKVGIVFRVYNIGYNVAGVPIYAVTLISILPISIISLYFYRVAKRKRIRYFK